MNEEESIRQQVFRLLEKNPLLTPTHLCELLRLPYLKHRQTVKNYRSQYKSNYENRQGPYRLSFHGVHFWGYALLGLDRGAAVTDGWVLTKARNRMMVWRDTLGRLEWFGTGRINGWVRKPGSKGKMLQILANAFYKTNLVQDINQFSKWADSFTLKGFHMVADTGIALPYMRIELLKESNGVVVQLGDASHRTSLEVQVEFPVWGERLELLTNQAMRLIESNTHQIEAFNDFMKELSAPKGPSKDDRMVS